MPMNVPALLQCARDALLVESSPSLCAWLSGSRSRGEAHAGSDVDIAVLLGHEPSPTLSGGALSLESRLEARLKLPVDLVVIDRAPVDLVHRILRDGRLLYENDPSARVRFEVRARREYFDLLPYLREYRGVRAGPAPWPTSICCSRNSRSSRPA